MGSNSNLILSNGIDGFVEVGNKLADAVGEVIRKYFWKSFEIIDKEDLSPVTIADRTAEEAMVNIIQDNLPSHAIFGEENGWNCKESTADYVWVLDPIDGTKSFITGKPLFGTLIALLDKGVPEHRVMLENSSLRQQVEELRSMLPVAELPMRPYLELNYTERKPVLTKHDVVSSNGGCNCATEKPRESDTSLHLGLSSEHRKRKAPERASCSNDSGGLRRQQDNLRGDALLLTGKWNLLRPVPFSLPFQN